MRAMLLRLASSLLLATAATADARDLLVFAAASLTDALTEVGRSYAASGNDRIVFNFGASSDLARQIRAGAPAEVFFSADTAQMDTVEQAGLVKHGDRVDVLSNLLVAVVPSASTAAVARPSDLAALARIALADPEAVPAGLYARKYLESLGLWAAIRDKVVPTLDVRAALAAVAGRHADAAIVYRTDAAASSRVRVAFEVPRAEGPPIVYPLAAVGTPPSPEARALARHLASPAALAVYERYGFVVIAGK